MAALFSFFALMGVMWLCWRAYGRMDTTDAELARFATLYEELQKVKDRLDTTGGGTGKPNVAGSGSGEQ